jgi:hypothetical protein
MGFDSALDAVPDRPQVQLTFEGYETNGSIAVSGSRLPDGFSQRVKIQSAMFRLIRRSWKSFEATAHAQSVDSSLNRQRTRDWALPTSITDAKNCLSV